MQLRHLDVCLFHLLVQRYHALSNSLAYLLPNKYCSILALCSVNLTRLLTFLVIAFYYCLSLLLFTTAS